MPRQDSITRDIRKISRTFRQLSRSFGRLGPLLQAAYTSRDVREATAKATPPGRRSPRLSAAQRRALILQGRYMGTMRGLNPAQQARVKKVREVKGIRAAIAAARRMAE